MNSMNTAANKNTKTNPGRLARTVRTAAAIASVASLNVAAIVPVANAEKIRNVPPTPLVGLAPVSPDQHNNISRLAPVAQRCFKIAAFDTVLNVIPTYKNKRTTRSMVLQANWMGLNIDGNCTREVDAELKITPTIEKNGEMRPSAKSRYVEIGRETEERLIAFPYTDTRNTCVLDGNGRNGIRSLHTGAIWELRVSGVAEDSVDYNSDGRPDVVTQYSIESTTLRPDQNRCLVPAR